MITFGTLQAKNAVRDTARVLSGTLQMGQGLSSDDARKAAYGLGDRICKMIGDELGYLMISNGILVVFLKTIRNGKKNIIGSQPKLKI